MGSGVPALGVGLGALISCAVLLVHRSGAFTMAAGVAVWKPFVAGAFAGLVLCGILVALFCAKDAFDAEGDIGAASHRRAAGRLSALAGAVLALLGALGSWWGWGPIAARVDVAGLAWEAGGVLAGAGVALLLVPYARACARVSLKGAFAALAVTWGTALVFDAVSLLLPSAALPAAVFVELAVAAGAACSLAGCASAPSPEGSTPPAAGEGCPCPCGEGSAPRRILGLAARTWRPVAGAVICMFIFGFTWDTDALAVQLNGAGYLAVEKLVGFGLAAAFLGVLACYRGGRDVQSILLTAVLPVMVVSFILRPYFLSAHLGPVALMVIGVARETGFALFLAAAWLSLAEGARVCRVSPSFAAAALAALCGLAALLGLYWLQVLGSIVNYVGAVLFTVYLAASVIAAAASGRSAAVVSEDHIKAAERQGFERFLEERCAEIAAEHGLTPREREIVLHLGRGHSYAYIAGVLGVSENTVRTHVRNMYRKLEISSREDLLEIIHRER